MATYCINSNLVPEVSSPCTRLREDTTAKPTFSLRGRASASLFPSGSPPRHSHLSRTLFYPLFCSILPSFFPPTIQTGLSLSRHPIPTHIFHASRSHSWIPQPIPPTSTLPLLLLYHLLLPPTDDSSPSSYHLITSSIRLVLMVVCIFSSNSSSKKRNLFFSPFSNPPRA